MLGSRENLDRLKQVDEKIKQPRQPDQSAEFGKNLLNLLFSLLLLGKEWVKECVCEDLD